jgi:hypothetical protein
VYPVLPVSLDCFWFVFLCLVYPIFPVSLDCFCFVCLRRTKTNKTKAIQRKW